MYIKELRIENQTLQDLPQVAEKIITFAKELKIWLFEGEMGSGKTTLIQQLAQIKGVLQHTHSPTFSIVNEYDTQQGEHICHFDFYRIADETEAYDIGYEEYLFSNRICWIEWPSKINTLLPTNNFLSIQITIQPDERRNFLIRRHE